METANTRSLKHEAVILDSERRSAVEAAIRETCADREWYLHALNVRTNHVHTVVSIGLTKPERALTALKAKSTKRMREVGCGNKKSTPWSVKGSKRRLWNERSVKRAIDYVLNGQGEDLPVFGDD